MIYATRAQDTGKRTRGRLGRSGIVGLLLALCATLPGTGTPAARADERCSLEERKVLCPDASVLCPPGGGPAASAWPMFQHDAQHTGQSHLDGPRCNHVVWRWPGTQPFLSTASIATDETIFVGNARFPVCRIDPGTGAALWCDTDQEGRLADRSAPSISADGTVHIGTRDNDLWAIAPGPAQGTVLWRQKICTDGDVTTSPTVGADGVIYMGSDSLGAGSLFAMCPGASRQVKWCTKLGGGLKNVSPALSPDGATLYVTTRGTTLHALDAATGAERWRRKLERRPNAARWPNYTPVVHPVTGTIYVGFDEGLFAVAPDGTVDLLFDTGRERMESPPALASDGTLYFGASRGTSSTFYAVRPDGSLAWSFAIPRGSGRFRNNQAAIGADGVVYFAVKSAVYALAPGGDGNGGGQVLWQLDETSVFQSGPIIGAGGRLYVGTGDKLAPTLLAIGDCP
jgi:outer membrane protein assembly factor BamB